jgi:protoheme IX farnesyltransferase
MRSEQAKVLRNLSLAALAVTFLLVIAGNVMRVSVGEPCPDWPLCYNAVLPFGNARAMAEVVHRVLVVIAGPILITLVALMWRWNASRGLLRMSIWALVLTLLQSGIGALTTFSQSQPTFVALHLTAGLATLGLVAAIFVATLADPIDTAEDNPATRKFRRSLITLAGAMFALVITGALVSGNGAALACGETFPICNGGWLPNGGRLVLLQWLHRFMVFAVGLLLLSFAAKAYRKGASVPNSIKTLAGLLLAGFLLQGVMGWQLVALNRPALLSTLHNALSAGLWAGAVALALLGQRVPLILPMRAPKVLPAWRQTINDYVALTKPKVISLLLFTTFAGMFITSAGMPAWYLVVWTMIGGYLMAGGANAVNMAYDIDIDNKMGRTSKRPTASGRISARNAYLFGFVLAGLSIAIFLLFVNWLSALLAVIGFLYYTVFYTKWLKRSTWQNIVIGGGAGAIPPLIGWAAASGQLSVAAIILFVIVFYWTPPHFWALALMKRKDYAAAGVPMLPVVAGEHETTRQMLIYSLGMVAITLVLVPLQAMGWIYFAGAVALGAWFMWLAWQLNCRNTPQAALKLYVYSLLYLFALFGVMMLDRVAQYI